MRRSRRLVPARAARKPPCHHASLPAGARVSASIRRSALAMEGQSRRVCRGGGEALPCNGGKTCPVALGTAAGAAFTVALGAAAGATFMEHGLPGTEQSAGDGGGVAAHGAGGAGMT